MGAPIFEAVRQFQGTGMMMVVPKRLVDRHSGLLPFLQERENQTRHFSPRIRTESVRRSQEIAAITISEGTFLGCGWSLLQRGVINGLSFPLKRSCNCNLHVPIPWIKTLLRGRETCQAERQTQSTNHDIRYLHFSPKAPQ